MKYATGNIWDFHANGFYIVICTNIGWKRDGANVMGAGLAKQALIRFPGIDISYGGKCRENGDRTSVILYSKHRVILFPTKALNEKHPHASWMANSNLQLIETSLQELVVLLKSDYLKGKKIAIPKVGCSNGKLSEKVVIPLMEKYLNEFDNVTLCI